MKIYVKYGMKPLSIGLSFATVLQFVIPPAQAQTPPRELNIVVVEGDGVTNKVRQRVTREPVIRVEDENHQPIAGAAVAFTLPTEGATGEFGNGSKNLTVMTDSQGQATAQGLKVNQIPGKLPIHINVSYRGLTARANITQFDEGPAAGAKAQGGHGGLIAVIVVVGAAAAGGAVFALRKNNSTSGSGTVNPPPVPSIGITPGTGTIVGPH
jgi:hypothetical protein